jgi:hypothetical protein
MVCDLHDDLEPSSRAAAARRNGAVSRGPLSPETKFLSSKNRLDHGVYAVVHSLPDEPPDCAAGLRQRWFDLKQPETVEEEFLVNEMFRGHLLSLRYHRAMDCVVDRQQVANISAFNKSRDDSVMELRQALETAPAEGIEAILAELRSFGPGIRSLIADFEALATALVNPGFWDECLMDTAILLLGARPGLEALSQRPVVYRLVLFNHLCMPVPPPGTIENLLRPENRPPALRHASRAELVYSAAECRVALHRWVQQSLAELRRMEQEVLEECDAPDIAAVHDQSAIVMSAEQVSRFQRMGSEYRAIAYRAQRAWKTLRNEAPADRPKPSRKNARPADRPGSDAPRGAAPAPAREPVIEATATVSEGHVDAAPAGGNTVAQMPVEQQVMEQAWAETEKGVESRNEPTIAIPGVVAACPKAPEPMESRDQGDELSANPTDLRQSAVESGRGQSNGPGPPGPGGDWRGWGTATPQHNDTGG